LRGCIGSLEARQPLALDVQEHAVDAAFHDFRFPPLTESELPGLHIELSILSAPEPLAYQNAEDLPGLLRPGVDGVILARGMRRATFLPQVWEKVSEPVTFLDMLCEKMGLEYDLWRRQKLDVFTYQVDCFEEEQP
jgi:AmmeMemoRadiSam system protein A